MSISLQSYLRFLQHSRCYGRLPDIAVTARSRGARFQQRPARRVLAELRRRVPRAKRGAPGHRTHGSVFAPGILAICAPRTAGKDRPLTREAYRDGPGPLGWVPESERKDRIFLTWLNAAAKSHTRRVSSFPQEPESLLAAPQAEHRGANQDRRVTTAEDTLIDN